MYSTREFATTSRAMPFASTAVSSSDTCIVSGRVLEESELDELRAEVEGMLARHPSTLRGRLISLRWLHLTATGYPAPCRCESPSSSALLLVRVLIRLLLFFAGWQSQGRCAYSSESYFMAPFRIQGQQEDSA